MKNIFFGLCLIGVVFAKHPPEGNLVMDNLKIIKQSHQQIDINSFLPWDEIVKNVLPEKDISRQEGTEAILNDYADKIFNNIHNLMLDDGFDPLALPEVFEGFNYTLIIVYHGEFNMTNGWLSDLATIHRGGDVVVFYSTDNKLLEITVPIAFEDMKFTYDYSAQIMGLGPIGYIDGIIRDLTIEVKLGFDTKRLLFSLNEFNIVHAGNIDLVFHGDALVDWLLDALAFIATDILGGIILMVVQNIVRGGLEGVVDQINNAIHEFLNPTTPIPTTTPISLFLG